MLKDAEIGKALQALLDGNKRFAGSKQIHPNQDKKRRDEVSKGQKPFAVVVGCSDSRIPPEILFDQGVGDLFTIRLAGNIVDDMALGSIEYAADHLGTRLVVVLGHSKCGAVTATVHGGDAHGHVAGIVNAIIPAVERAKEAPGDLVDNAIRENAKLVAANISSSKPILEKMVQEGRIAVVTLYYDIETGLVEIL